VFNLKQFWNLIIEIVCIVLSLTIHIYLLTNGCLPSILPGKKAKGRNRKLVINYNQEIKDLGRQFSIVPWLSPPLLWSRQN
jgi:hypothetical protein